MKRWWSLFLVIWGVLLVTFLECSATRTTINSSNFLERYYLEAGFEKEGGGGSEGHTGRFRRQLTYYAQRCRAYEPEIEVVRPPDTYYACMRMETYPGASPRSIHIKIRFDRRNRNCKHKAEKIGVFGMNEEGWPCGQMRLADDDKGNKCSGEDLDVTRGDTRETIVRECVTIPGDKRHKQIKDSSMIVVKAEYGKKSWDGVCLTWYYDESDKRMSPGDFPKRIQIRCGSNRATAFDAKGFEYYFTSNDFEFSNQNDPTEDQGNVGRRCHDDRSNKWMRPLGSKTNWQIPEDYLDLAEKQYNWGWNVETTTTTRRTTTTTTTTTTTEPPTTTEEPTTEPPTTQTEPTTTTTTTKKTTTTTTELPKTTTDPELPKWPEELRELRELPIIFGLADGKSGGYKKGTREYLHPPTPISVYAGCVEQTKNCIVPQKGKKPRECLEKKNCEFVIAFGLQDPDALASEVVIEMYHRDPGTWFAIGLCLNDRPTMSNSFVLECLDDGFLNLETPVVYNSFNVAQTYANKRLSGNQSSARIIRWVKSARSGGSIYCRFPIKLSFSRTDPASKITTNFLLHKNPHFVVAAWGKNLIPKPTGNLLKHGPKDVLKKPKHKTLIGGRFAPTKEQQFLIREHGLIMIWATLFFFPCGILIARYGKETLVKAKILNRIPLWRATHVMFMILGTGLFTAAMVIQGYGHIGWVSLRPSPFHAYGGGIMGGLLLFTFLHGWCVSPTLHSQKKRNWGGIVHAILGHSTVALGFFLILRSETVSFSNTPCQVKWVVLAFAFSYTMIFVGLSYHYCWVDWVVGLEKTRSCGPIPFGILTEVEVSNLLKRRKSRTEGERNVAENDTEFVEAPGRQIRIGGLVMLASLGILYAGWSTALLLDSKRSCGGDSYL